MANGAKGRGDLRACGHRRDGQRRDSGQDRNHERHNQHLDEGQGSGAVGGLWFHSHSVFSASGYRHRGPRGEANQVASFKADDAFQLAGNSEEDLRGFYAEPLFFKAVVMDLLPATVDAIRAAAERRITDNREFLPASMLSRHCQIWEVPGVPKP